MGNFIASIAVWLDPGYDYNITVFKEPQLRLFPKFQRFWYPKKAHIFSLPLVNFTAEKCNVWKINLLMKM